MRALALAEARYLLFESTPQKARKATGGNGTDEQVDEDNDKSDEDSCQFPAFFYPNIEGDGDGQTDD